MKDDNRPDNENRRDMARRSDPETSKDAAESVRLTKDRKECRAHLENMLASGFLNGHDDFSQKELRAYLVKVMKLPYERADSLRRRVTDLDEKVGSVYVTGERRNRAQLYRLKPEKESDERLALARLYRGDPTAQ